MMSLTKWLAVRPPRRRLVLAALAVLSALCSSVPAAQAGPGSGPSAVVSMGDSYISGEAGRWQGNSESPAPGNAGSDRACAPAGSPLCQVDKSRVYVGASATDGCHRSDVAEVLSASLPVAEHINISCSGGVSENLWRSGNGGQSSEHGEPSQVDQLVQVAKTNDVKTIIVSDGGNDVGFADIVRACFQAFLSKQGPCQPTQQAKLAQEIPAATLKVEKAIDEIRAVMAADGYGPTDYRLVWQGYPSVIPRASEARYSETDPQRNDTCPFYDQDLTWGRDQASVEIGQMVRNAAAARGVEFMDLENLLQGHEICSKSDSLVTPSNPPSSRTSEWGRFLGPSSIQQGDTQEIFHPNAFAQHALGLCLSQLYAQSPGNFACVDMPGGDNNAITLRRVGQLPSSNSSARVRAVCTSRRTITLHLAPRFRGRVLSARVLVNGRRIGRLGPRHRSLSLDLRGHRAGAVTVRIVMRLHGGRTVTDTRRFHPCTRGRAVTPPVHRRRPRRRH
jgi:hypothetical protein